MSWLPISYLSTISATRSSQNEQICLYKETLKNISRSQPALRAGKLGGPHRRRRHLAGWREDQVRQEQGLDPATQEGQVAGLEDDLGGGEVEPRGHARSEHFLSVLNTSACTQFYESTTDASPYAKEYQLKECKNPRQTTI